MPDIVIRCPVTGDAVPTGLNTDTIVFSTLPNVEMPLRCPHCGHRSDARIVGRRTYGNELTHGLARTENQHVISEDGGG